MDVGLQMVCATYGWTDVSDEQAYDEEIKLALQAADAGFDALWAVEHHHHDYSFCPDNIQLMTHLAALRPNIDVGTAAVILPWNDPLRVAEKVSMIDHFTNGRFRLGIGRGLARREFEAFRVNMDESRERFDEAAAMIVSALETGWMEGEGPHYKQPRVEIRRRFQ
ncbi:MAG: LLM class flavin-dependent oxidoreductase [Alphaproteobacteria bacterium]